jgi:hypothetical protein
MPLHLQIAKLRSLYRVRMAFPMGHFYSPIVNPKELNGHYRNPDEWPPPEAIPGIDLARQSQIDLWEQWLPFFADMAALTSGSGRYKFDKMYGIGDCAVYSCMLRHFKPKRVIEVGSGESSALALDVCDQFLQSRTRFTFIEPYPDRLLSFLEPEDHERVEIIKSRVQDVRVERFEELQANDILFIDSAHVMKTGSDVHFELFEIMPRLKPGVIVHFHDCFYPFEYPRRWVMDQNNSWNELYALRAFLTGNRAWEILFFNDYFAKIERDRVARDAVDVLRNPGGGLWLRRVTA